MPASPPSEHVEDGRESFVEACSMLSALFAFPSSSETLLLDFGLLLFMKCTTNPEMITTPPTATPINIALPTWLSTVCEMALTFVSDDEPKLSVLKRATTAVAPTFFLEDRATYSCS